MVIQKRIKQLLHPDWYYANSTEDEMAYHNHHLGTYYEDS